MNRSSNPSSPQSKPKMAPSLLDVAQFAEILGCSARHIRRLSDMGKCPAPIKLGSLARWPRAVVEEWIEGGCRNVRNVRGGGEK